jgi:hypothetical protein
MGLMTDLVNLQLGAFRFWFLVKVFLVKQPHFLSPGDRISLIEYNFDFLLFRFAMAHIFQILIN